MTPLNAPGRHAREGGIALVLVIIFTILLYVLVAELVVTARMQRLTGENDALLARMDNHMRFTLVQIEEQLVDDLEAGATEEAMGAEEGGLPGMGGLPGLGGGGEPGEEGEEEANDADSSQDAWYEPTSYADDDLTTYTWVEDENRKFNILCLASPDEEFAASSRERFVRLIDFLREDSVFDLSSSTGETMATEIIDWLNARGRTELIPRPPLKSDDEDSLIDQTIPLHLEELLMLPSITDDIYFDKVVDDRFVPGLEGVLTIYTSLVFDPGEPGALGPGGESPVAGNNAEPTGLEGLASGGSAADQPIGVGVKINVNTAPRAVLRCLFPEHEVPNAVIEAILRHRNEEEEEDEEELSENDLAGAEYFGDLNLGEQAPRKIFTTLEDLEELPEFENLGNPEIKQRFFELTTVKSDVFSVHMASMYKRNEQRRIFVMRRATSVLARFEDNGAASIHPLILLEERQGVRIQPLDFPDEYNSLDYQVQLDELDQFAQEERRWNPFYYEFYLPPEQRQ